MSSAWFVAVCLMAMPADGNAIAEASLAADSATPAAKDLPDAVQDALRRFQQSSTREREELVPELTALYERVGQTTGLELTQRRRLQGVLERRLRQAERTLVRRRAREKRAANSQASHKQANRKQPAAATIQAASARPAVLAQQVGAQGQAGGGGGGGPGGPQTGQTAANAQQLIDLIRATICPETWAAGGGNGRIFYYSPLQVLVVTH